MTATMTLEERAASAARAHRAKGTQSLGTLLVIRSEGIEIPVTQAEELARDVGLSVENLPTMRTRSAITKALHSLGIQPSAKHGQDERGESSCVRYSRVSAAGGDVVFLLQEEEIRMDGQGLPHATSREVQRVAYFAKDRKLEVYDPYRQEEILAAYENWKGQYKADSIRSFVERCLVGAEAVKFAGSTWFVPDGDAGRDTIARLRQFCRRLTGLSFVAVAVLDEPGSREDLVFSAAASVEAEFEAISKRLAEARDRKEQGVSVRGETAERILEDGRALREKLRTLRTLIGLESKKVDDSLDSLDTSVRAFLETV